MTHRVFATPFARFCAASSFLVPFTVAGCSAGGASSAPPVGAGGAVAAGAPGTFPGAAGNAPGGSPSTTNPGSFVGVDGGIIANPPVDPSIRFDWAVDDPNPASLSCQPGHYTGLFVGLYTSPITVVGVPIPVTGNVDLDAGAVVQRRIFHHHQRLRHRARRHPRRVSLQLLRTLNCTTKKLEKGSIDCKYCVGAYAADGGLCLGLESHFIGPVTADYDAANQAFENATWKGKEGADAGVFGGLGTWTAAYTP